MSPPLKNRFLSSDARAFFRSPLIADRAMHPFSPKIAAIVSAHHTQKTRRTAEAAKKHALRYNTPTV